MLWILSILAFVLWFVPLWSPAGEHPHRLAGETHPPAFCRLLPVPLCPELGTCPFLKLLTLGLGTVPNVPSDNNYIEPKPELLLVRQEWLCSGSQWNVAVGHARTVPLTQYTIPSSPPANQCSPPHQHLTWGRFAGMICF